jgi:RNA polymerase sigma-70 factor (ECF subfamily)
MGLSCGRRNPVYEQWRDADESQRPDLEAKLFEPITDHAEIVVWTKLGENNRDVIGDIVLGVMKGIRKFRGDSQFSTWVHQIALNKVIDEIDRRSRERRMFADIPGLDADEEGDMRVRKEPPDLVEPPDLAARVDAERLIEPLREDERALLELKCKGYTDEQIATILRITLDAAESRWRRLRHKVRKNVPGAAGK